MSSKVLDVTGAVSQNWQTLKEVVLFISQPVAPEVGLGLYVAVGDGGWNFRYPFGISPLFVFVPDVGLPALPHAGLGVIDNL